MRGPVPMVISVARRSRTAASLGTHRPHRRAAKGGRIVRARWSREDRVNLSQLRDAALNCSVKNEQCDPPIGFYLRTLRKTVINQSSSRIILERPKFHPIFSVSHR